MLNQINSQGCISQKHLKPKFIIETIGAIVPRSTQASDAFGKRSPGCSSQIIPLLQDDSVLAFIFRANFKVSFQSKLSEGDCQGTEEETVRLIDDQPVSIGRLMNNGVIIMSCFYLFIYFIHREREHAWLSIKCLIKQC